MKRKLSMFAIFFALGLMLVGPQNAEANTWVVASIRQVGQDFGHSIVVLTHVSSKPVFTNKVFRLMSTNKREMLAVALTAASMGKNVRVLIHKDGVTINRIRLMN